jgi:hypothetical protein
MCEVARSDNKRLYNEFKLTLGKKSSASLNASCITSGHLDKSQISQSRRSSIGRYKNDYSTIGSTRMQNVMIDTDY